jgi:hypothetical protein
MLLKSNLDHIDHESMLSENTKANSWILFDTLTKQQENISNRRKESSDINKETKKRKKSHTG